MSRRQDVLDNIKTALAAIATGSGYNYTVGTVALGFRHFQQIPEDKFPVALVCGADEKRSNVTNSEFKSMLSASVVIYVRNSIPEDPEQLEKDLSKFISDVTKAVYTDPTRGGYSRKTEVVSVDCDKGAFQPYAGAEIVVECDYKSTATTP